MLNTLTSKGGLTATTALVACGFLFLTPTGQDLWQTGAPTLFQEAGREARIAEEVANAPGNFTTPVPAPRAENQDASPCPACGKPSTIRWLWPIPSQSNSKIPKTTPMPRPTR